MLINQNWKHPDLHLVKTEGCYTIKGPLDTHEDLCIDIDMPLVIEGSVHAFSLDSKNTSIHISGHLHVREEIRIHGDLSCEGKITSLNGRIVADGSVHSGESCSACVCIVAGGFISAEEDLLSGGWISAGGNISSGRKIVSKREINSKSGGIFGEHGITSSEGSIEAFLHITSPKGFIFSAQDILSHSGLIQGYLDIVAGDHFGIEGVSGIFTDGNLSGGWISSSDGPIIAKTISSRKNIRAGLHIVSEAIRSGGSIMAGTSPKNCSSEKNLLIVCRSLEGDVLSGKPYFLLHGSDFPPSLRPSSIRQHGLPSWTSFLT